MEAKNIQKHANYFCILLCISSFLVWIWVLVTGLIRSWMDLRIFFSSAIARFFLSISKQFCLYNIIHKEISKFIIQTTLSWFHDGFFTLEMSKEKTESKPTEPWNWGRIIVKCFFVYVIELFCTNCSYNQTRVQHWDW